MITLKNTGTMGLSLVILIYVTQFNNSTLKNTYNHHLYSTKLTYICHLYSTEYLTHPRLSLPPDYYRDTIGSFREGVSGSAFLTRYKLFFICRI